VSDDLRAAYYCAAEVMRNRRRTGQPIPAWLTRHFQQLHREVSPARHINGVGEGERSGLEHEHAIGTREAAAILGCSQRQLQRRAASIGCRKVARNYVISQNQLSELAG